MKKLIYILCLLPLLATADQNDISLSGGPRSLPSESNPWNRDSLVYRPSALESSANSVIAVDGESFDEFGNWSSDAIECANVIPAGIPALLQRGRPSAVGWLIVSVTVFSVDAESWRALPHVGKKVLEGPLPPLANLYSAPAIKVVVLALGVSASLFHFAPCAISFCPAGSVRSTAKALVKFREATTGHPCGGLHGEELSAALAFAGIASMDFCYDDKVCELDGLDGNSFGWHNSVYSLLCSVTGVRLQPALVAIMRNVTSQSI